MKRVLKNILTSIVTGSFLLNSINVFANETQVVKVSIGSTVANVNGYDTTLTFAPYIQQPSDSMMIPLRFVSTGLGIDESNIQYNPNTKEVTITYNGTTAKFIVGTNKLILNGEEFSMLIENTHPVYTEIKNGSTFIPLRSLELAFGVKIDWEASTKTAILTNKIEDNKTTNQVVQQPIKEETTPIQTEEINNSSNKTEETLTEEQIRAMEEEVVGLVNEERAKYGLQPLEISEKLMQTAREKSKDMATNNYFSHTAPNGYNMARDLNVAENIATSDYPDIAMDLWLTSTKGHKENILSPNDKYIGVGFDNGYWTQQFSKDDKWAN